MGPPAYMRSETSLCGAYTYTPPLNVFAIRETAACNELKVRTMRQCRRRKFKYEHRHGTHTKS
jgi:hypothetical protein